jgi:beta-lactamase class D
MTTNLRICGAAFAWTALIFAMVVGASAETRNLDSEAYKDELRGLTVAFLARDLSSGVEYVLDGSDIVTAQAPWSTFKIPNLLIALETGVASSLDDWRDWDPALRPAADHWPDIWKQGQTLRDAFERSSVWYFQDLALEIGGPVYRQYLGSWAYGNADVPDMSDTFWLGEGLRISVREQVDFLDRLLSNKLGVSKRSIEALDTASLSGKLEEVTLHGKTGSGPDDWADLDGKFSGWYVGYLRRGDLEPVVFALHVSADSYSALRDFRKEFSVRLLEDAGLAPLGLLRTN